MVAITVILAAVIGTFVLNLGGNLEQTPQAQLSIEQGDAAGEVDISHGGGDTLQVSDLQLVDGDGTDLSGAADGSWSGEFSVGDSTTLSGGNLPAGGNEVTVRVIHSPSDSILVERTLTVPS